MNTRAVRGVHVTAVVVFVATCSATLVLAGGDPRAPRSAAEEAKVELGRRLFFDPAASRAGMRSCADCHDPRHGYSDAEPTSRDDRGPTRRHSQTLIDGADNPSAHWDGEFRRIEDLVTARLTLSGKKGGGHGLGADARGGSPAPASGGGSYGGGGGGRGTAPADGVRPVPEGGGQPAAMADPGGAGVDGSGGGDDGYGGGGEGGGGQDGGGQDGGTDCRPPARAPASAGGGRSAEDPPPAATEPEPSAAAGGDGTSAPTRPPDAGAPAAGRASDPARAPDRPAGTAPRADPYAEDAFGTSPDESLDFVSPQVDLTRLDAVGATLEATGRYREAFVAAYGSPSITTQRIADAIATHCRAIRSGESAYDRFTAGDEKALSPAARRGFDLFRGAAGCASCHSTAGRRAAFTDYRVHDTGVAWKGAPAVVAKPSPRDADDRGDLGAMAASSRPQDRRAFKTPTLRDVARRGPYMHDGSVRTLEAAVRHYLSGAINDPALDEKMPRIVATDGEVADLVAFLKSLTSAERPGRAASAWPARARSTALRFVDADGKPLASWHVTLAPAGDVVPGGLPAKPLSLVTDEAGRVEFTPPSTTHVRVVLEGGLRPTGGALVPDTCRAAEIEIPVRGRCHVLAVLPAAKSAPAGLVVEHPEARFLPDRRTPRTILRLDAELPFPDGRVVALYSAPLRTDVPARSVLRLPQKTWGLDRIRVVLDPESTVELDLTKRR